MSMSGLLDSRARNLAITAVSCLAVVALWFIAGHVITFKPFTLLGYTAIPPADCPNAPLKLDVRYNLIEPALVTAEGYRLRTNWVEDATGSDTELAPYSGTFEAFERGYNQVIESPHYRTAPPAPGEWRVYAEMVVTGSVLGWPREQIIPGQIYDGTFSALPADHERCSPL
jgi:hypothetical protein